MTIVTFGLRCAIILFDVAAVVAVLCSAAATMDAAIPVVAAATAARAARTLLLPNLQ